MNNKVQYDNNESYLYSDCAVSAVLKYIEHNHQNCYKDPFFLMLLYFCALVGIAFKYYNPTDVYPGEGNMSTVSSGQP